MEFMTLGQALENEHREIDGGIESFVAAMDSRGPTSPTSLLTAFSGLRRHIYLEETFLFPPLKAAGLMGPLFVMLREHGQLWNQMGTIESLLSTETQKGGEVQKATQGQKVTLRSACAALLQLLDAHNSKEETIIYAQADEILDSAAGSELLSFLEKGTMPHGWVCGVS